jgi:hypothetical protein
VAYGQSEEATEARTHLSTESSGGEVRTDHDDEGKKLVDCTEKEEPHDAPHTVQHTDRFGQTTR